ncbi:hypothetical protein GCG21_09745 [Pseudactinotalea sp. HY160]|uniref:hypothetical protein n=1 Tax=Pseudactinotalea sp. HY160 TaxID=2654490 RepID=UPI00128E2ECF|nr:hypothetical protein [Pseudactinotalea sp. HY160]MPV50280.1 hypothetical protein [Pseudactinotalea sp. HY160]
MSRTTIDEIIREVIADVDLPERLVDAPPYIAEQVERDVADLHLTETEAYARLRADHAERARERQSPEAIASAARARHRGRTQV